MINDDDDDRATTEGKQEDEGLTNDMIDERHARGLRDVGDTRDARARGGVVRADDEDASGAERGAGVRNDGVRDRGVGGDGVIGGVHGNERYERE